MNNTLINLVQKCICIDFILNALIKSNTFAHLRFIPKIKSENLQNIKIICYLYECVNKDVLVLSDTRSIKIDKKYENQIDTLLELFTSVIEELNSLKQDSDLCPIYGHLINRLLDSYLGFFSSSYCLLHRYSSKNTASNNFDFYGILTDNIINSSNYIPSDSESHPEDYFRNFCIDSIKYFFDFDLLKEGISDESYEIFFENNPNNKFYQFYFKSSNRRFKVKINDSDTKIFNIYQYIEFSPSSGVAISQDDATKLCDSYLSLKFTDIFEFLVLDSDYVSKSTYSDVVESYKLKYNYLDEFGKVDLKKSLFVTVDTLSSYIEELTII